MKRNAYITLALLTTTFILCMSFASAALNGTCAMVVGDASSVAANELAVRTEMMDSSNQVFFCTEMPIIDDGWGNMSTSYDPDVYYIADSVSGSTMGTKINATTNGIVASDNYGNNGICTDVQTINGQTTWNITNITHPISNWTTLGLNTWSTDSNANYQRCNSASWGAGVTQIAQIFELTARSHIIVYDFGDKTTNGHAAGRRVQLSPQPTTSNYWNDYMYNMTQHAFLWASNVSGGGGGAPPVGGGSGNGTLVINLTFDDNAHPWRDYSAYNHTFVSSNAEHENDTDICLYYGCLDVDDDENDNINTITKFNRSSMAISMWVYFNRVTGESNSASIFLVGNGSQTRQWTEYGTYGYSSDWTAENGAVGNNMPDDSIANFAWHHVFLQYDENTEIYQTWVDVYNYVNDTETGKGALNYTLSENFQLGLGRFGIELDGYIDEVLVWNRGNFTEAEIQALYDNRIEGTPPERDFYVANVTQNDTHLFYGIKNAGTLAGGATFTTKAYYGGVEQCSDDTTLAAGAGVVFNCPINHTGLIEINISIDTTDAVAEDDEQNNDYISFINYCTSRPCYHPALNLTYLTTGDNPAENAYDWRLTQVEEDFNPGWGAGDIDPRARKGWGNALSCYLHNYSSPGNQCAYAYNHLEGWLNGSISPQDYADASVQSTNQFMYVGLTYDLLYNDMSEQERQVYGQELYDRCIGLTTDDNTRPYLDPDVLDPANGWGFGTGIGYSCFVISGELDEHPTVELKPSDQYKLFSVNDEWIDRALSQLHAQQGGCEAEGLEYFSYTTYNQGWYLWTLKNMGYREPNQADVDGKLSCLPYWLLDFNFDGQRLNSNVDNYQWTRWDTRGDSYPYKLLGEHNDMGTSSFLTFAALTDNQTILDAVFTVRNALWQRDPAGKTDRPTADMFFYEMLAQRATNLTPQGMVNNYGRFLRDPNWDTAYFKSNYTWSTDTYISFDGGEFPGFGHPQAEFDLTVCYRGLCFVSQRYVPYEDDVRSEWWANTLALTDDSGAKYASSCTDPALNVGFQGSDEQPLADYPNAQYNPAACTGSMNDTFMHASLFHGGGRMFAKYNNTDADPERRIVFLGDFLLESFTINRSSPGYAGISYMNIDEFVDVTVSGTTLQMANPAGTVHYEIELIHNTTPMTVNCSSTIAASNGKTSNTYNVSYYRCEYDTNSAEDERLVLLHHWWTGAEPSYSILDNTDSYGVNTGDHNLTLEFVNQTVWYLLDGDINGSTPPAPDTTPPVITNVANVSITQTAATITWTTDEDSNSSVDYGNTTGLGTTQGSAGLTTSHSVGLTGLTANTTYFFNVTSCDASDNCNTTGTYSFTTNAPSGSSPAASSGGYSIPGLVTLMIVIIALSILGLIYVMTNDQKMSTPANVINLILITLTSLVAIIILWGAL